MSFDINKDLDIILITYNRADKLKKIVSDILYEDSPIRNCSITFLDNCSSDGTSEYLKELSIKYNNITHIRHKINIGGNANIVRAFEYVNKKYFWILCDDDRLDFTYWKNIEDALKTDKYDLIQTFADAKVAYGYDDKTRLAKLILEIVFLPGAIYKSINIDSYVLLNSYINIYALIPHMALISKIINENKNIYYIESNNNILIQALVDKADYFRGANNKKNVHHFLKDMDLSIGFILSLKLFNDKELQHKCLDIVRGYNGVNFQGYIMNDLPYYWIRAGMYDNILPIYDTCNDMQKKSFIELLIYMKNIVQIKTSINIKDFHFIYLCNTHNEYIFSILGFTKLYNKYNDIDAKANSIFSLKINKSYIKINFLFFINIIIKRFKDI
ncbi:glycosyltransferase [uncultured Brachyspira sp.]|uniref:glycosyltransferase family 2 protein n=1 Tax=uncultured Brachyspira sp. TaxID=221953 RepID=UPI0025DD212B|nr:glycosyltransferase [uncultured Brachyspira sp.]